MRTHTKLKNRTDQEEGNFNPDVSQILGFANSEGLKFCDYQILRFSNPAILKPCDFQIQGSQILQFSNPVILKSCHFQILRFSNSVIWGRHRQQDDSLVGQLTIARLT